MFASVGASSEELSALWLCGFLWFRPVSPVDASSMPFIVFSKSVYRAIFVAELQF